MNDEPIVSFTGEYDFLSNFYMRPVEFKGIVYPSTEHAYQAQKAADPKEMERIAKLPTAGKAKRYGKTVRLVENWDEHKYSIMYWIVRAKFRQHEDLKKLLIATDPRDLIEGNDWGDELWGKVQKHGQWFGKNWLGNILMLVRSELIHNKA